VQPGTHLLLKNLNIFDPKLSNCELQQLILFEGGYVRIYLKFTILKNYMHRARAALVRAKVGGMSQL
jgi:hypothetical protein